MTKAHSPRSGSMQFWPRVRAKRAFARIRNFSIPKEAKPAGFAGYKVGMTHVLITDNRKTSTTKGEELSCPVTVLECPPLKVVGARAYKKVYAGKQTTLDMTEKRQKELKPEDFDDISLIVSTNPKATGTGKKQGETFELAIGGSKEEKLAFAKENMGKEIRVSDVFEEGAQLNASSVTKGKGYQGPVKRFGIGLTSHKSEKVRRGPGSLGSWKGQGHMMYRIAYAGKMGYHQRTEYNKQVIKIADDPKEINVKGGFKKYGEVKNQYLLIKGSLPGPAKRMIILTHSKRKSKKIPQEAPSIEEINLDSNQGR